MPPAEIKGGRTRAAAQEQVDPRGASGREIGADHPGERPPLQMPSLQKWVEDDASAAVQQPHAELDVLDRGTWKALVVEATDCEEGIATNGAKARPEGRGNPRGALVHVVVEEVPELRDGSGWVGIVVV